MSVKRLKISVSGVRGVVGEALKPSLVCSFASAFGQYVGRGRVVVGRDTRITGEMYEKAVIAGLLSVGCQPVVIGIVPTPTVQIAVKELNAKGGIAITASHNPIEWNALKLIGGSGIFLNKLEARELLDIYNQADRAYVPESEYRNVRYRDDFFDLHKKLILEKIDTQILREKKLKVAVDCCNGAGAQYTKAFLEELGCEVFAINTLADGVFHRLPEPVPDNLGLLREEVIKNGCDIGFAQDPDADRIVVIDEQGNAIGEQNSIVLASEYVLSSCEKRAVVVNVQTTKAVGDIAKKYGCECIYTPVGEINVTEQMLKLGSLIGGEGGSGGIIYPAVHPCRDSFTGMVLILLLLAERKVKLSELMNLLPIYSSAGVKLQCSGEYTQRVIRQLTKKYERYNPSTIDGLRLDFEESWVLIRGSNTEPIIRIYAEARDKIKAEQLVADFEQEILEMIK